MGAVEDKIINFDQKKEKVDAEGYPVYEFDFDGDPVSLRIHEVIAQALIPNPDCAPYVIHKDGNKKNYDISNLEWSFEDDDGNECEDADFETVFGNPFIVLAANNIKEYVESQHDMRDLIDHIQHAALMMFGKPMGDLKPNQQATVREYASELSYDASKWKPIILTPTKSDKSIPNPVDTGFLVNRIGHVWDKKNKRYSESIIRNDGYTVVCVDVMDKNVYMRVDKLVATAFVPNPLHRPYVVHRDGVKHNNFYKNLMWSHTPYWRGEMYDDQ